MLLAFRRPGGEAAGRCGWALCRITVASHNMFWWTELADTHTSQLRCVL